MATILQFPSPIVTDRATARQQTQRFVDVVREAIRPVSPRVVLPDTLRTMLKDFLRGRSATLETATACIMAVVPRLSAIETLTFAQDVAFRLAEIAASPVFGDPMALHDAETHAEAEANKMMPRALAKDATAEVRMLTARTLYRHASTALQLGNRLMGQQARPPLTLVRGARAL